MSTTLFTTTLATYGTEYFSAPIVFNSTLTLTLTQTSNLINTPINAAAWAQLLFSADGGETWVPVAMRLFTLDDQTDVQKFTANEIKRYAAVVYSEPTTFYVGGSTPTPVNSNYPITETFQAPFTHMMLLLWPPTGDTRGLSVSVTATQG